MIIAGTDIESTGLSQEDGHRIVEICFRSYDSDSRELVDSYTTRINPKRSIDAKAQEVHGISIAELAGEKTWAEVAPLVQRQMANADLMVAHNMNFDGPFIAMELARVGLEIPSTEVFCTMKEARWATPLGKNPNLKELCFALGVEYDPSKAHGAEYDVDVMMKCLFKGIDQGAYTIPKLADVPRAIEAVA